MRTHHFFFSFRTSDKQRVEKLLEGIKSCLPNFPIQDISQEVPFCDDWKHHALEQIQRSDGLICVVGKETAKSDPVNWEIEEAVRQSKPVVIAQLDDGRLPSACHKLNIKPIKALAPKVAEKICDLLVPKALLEGVKVPIQDEQLTLVWNQYSLMVQSWEALISRRQTVNNIYLTGNATILAAIGVFVGSFKDVGASPSLYGGIMLSLLGGLLSLNWLQTIVSYGTLSQAKSKVVLALEHYLPAKLFDTEWAVLEAKKYRSTTRGDKLASQFFILLFIMMFSVLTAMKLGWMPLPQVNDGKSASTQTG